MLTCKVQESILHSGWTDIAAVDKQHRTKSCGESQDKKHPYFLRKVEVKNLSLLFAWSTHTQECNVRCQSVAGENERMRIGVG